LKHDFDGISIRINKHIPRKFQEITLAFTFVRAARPKT